MEAITEDNEIMQEMKRNLAQKIQDDIFALLKKYEEPCLALKMSIGINANINIVHYSGNGRRSKPPMTIAETKANYSIHGITNQECLKGIKRVQGYQDLSEWEKKFDNIASLYAHNKNKEGYDKSSYVKERAATMLFYAEKELAKQGNMGISEATKQKLEDNLNKALGQETPESCNEFLEGQGEQKPTDKAEPKFKVDDWVVNTITNDVEKIIEVTSNEYICSGNLIVSFDNQHLLKKWTIQDAKDGDILVSRSNQPFIYNGKMDAQAIGSHGGVLSDGTVFACGFDDCNWTDIRFIYPATKEQCDLLFSKMREAGYKWDMEKKELKKLKG